MKHERTNFILLLTALVALAVLADGFLETDDHRQAVAVYDMDRDRRMETLTRVRALEDSVTSQHGRNRALFARRTRIRAALMAPRAPGISRRTDYRDMVRLDDRLLAEMYAETALRVGLAEDYRRLSDLYEKEAHTRDAAMRACRQASSRRRLRHTVMTVAATVGITLLIVEK